MIWSAGSSTGRQSDETGDDNDPRAAVLVVDSTIRNVSFQCRGGIRKVTQPEVGVYRVFLPRGVHYVEIRAAGHLLLKLPRWNFAAKSGRKIRV